MHEMDNCAVIALCITELDQSIAKYIQRTYENPSREMRQFYIRCILECKSEKIPLESKLADAIINKFLRSV